MAVAVKPNRETTTPSMLDRLPVGIVAGVLYILGSIGIVFPLLDSIWWRWLGLDRANLVAWSLLLVVGFLVALGLTFVGLRLLGPKPTPGLKAGITCALIWVFVTLLLTTWIGMHFEDAAVNGWFGASGRAVGVGLTAGVGVILLILGFRFLFSAGMERWLVGFEHQGWFTSAPYKRSQGVRVRRGTILGLLILAAFGLWSLHNTLNREGGDWTLAFPFTDRVAVELNTAGDNPLLQAKLKDLQIKYDLEAAAETAQKDAELQQNALRDHPDATGRDKLTQELDQAGKDLAALKDEIAAKGDSPAEAPRLQTQLDDIKKRLAATRQTLADQTPKIVVDAAPKVQPTLAVLPIDRFELVERNRAFENAFVKVKSPGQDPNLKTYKGPDAEAALKHWDTKTTEVFKPGEIVSKVEFEAVTEALREDRKQVQEKSGEAEASLITLPVAEDAGGKAQVTPASGPLEYTQVTLLPNVKYTIPLILAVLSLWLAWRLVNVPAFADFLIATEAEMNKVSWATRKQLAQDTVVVLVTVILMAIFLFAADIIWSQGLKMIGVLQSGQTTANQQNEKEVPW
jgi:preprotein translocase SecE subunit